MSAEIDIKQQVKDFYNQVGWQEVSQGVYQNAHYEDLRPVSRTYIQRCHLRLLRHLRPSGRFLLDAGSGPIQYPAYLEYSKGYQRRVCADISIIALKEARQRIGEHGHYVVCDIANLPFKSEAFEGIVSLHTIHHLPETEHLQAYSELYRLLSPGCAATVVNGWPGSRLMRWAEPLIRLNRRTRSILRRLLKRTQPTAHRARHSARDTSQVTADTPKGTYTSRHDAAWIRSEVARHMPVQIWVWRSVSVRFLRNFIYPQLGGRLWLRLLYWLEERFPHWLGENGQYPLIVIRKVE
ncbi:MAG TPA: class I SAM-dependent methyltransferase [Anaerolineales bacterium]